MNENLNLVDILKECPRGTKLYSTVHGEVEFYQIVGNSDYPISFEYKNKKGDVYIASVTMEGKYSSVDGGECILFPSKENRDWSKFNIEPKFDINTLQPFDKVLVRDFDDDIWKCNFYEKFKGDKNYPFITMCGPYKQCVPYNNETKHLANTTKMPIKKYITWEE